MFPSSDGIWPDRSFSPLYDTSIYEYIKITQHMISALGHISHLYCYRLDMYYSLIEITSNNLRLPSCVGIDPVNALPSAYGRSKRQYSIKNQVLYKNKGLLFMLSQSTYSYQDLFLSM